MKVKIIKCPRAFAWYAELLNKIIEVEIAERTSQMDMDVWYLLEEDIKKYLDPKTLVTERTKLRWIRARYCEIVSQKDL